MALGMIETLLALGVSGLGIVAWWLVVVILDNRQRVAVLEARAEAFERSVAGIGRIHQRIDEIARDVSHLDGRLSEISATMRRMDTYLRGAEG